MSQRCGVPCTDGHEVDEQHVLLTQACGATHCAPTLHGKPMGCGVGVSVRVGVRVKVGVAVTVGVGVGASEQKPSLPGMAQDCGPGVVGQVRDPQQKPSVQKVVAHCASEVHALP